MEDKTKEINEFIESLKNEIASEMDEEYNNPWKCKTNCENLSKFLNKYENTEFILIGEAPGKKGCLQCGVPFCDDYTIEKLIDTTYSKIKKSKETSAQRIYEVFGNRFIAWNAFPYQPCNKNGNNRSPNKKELEFGEECLSKFIEIFNKNKNKKILALGNNAQKSCEKICKNKQYNYVQIIHPSCQADIKRKKLGYEGGMDGWIKYIEKELGINRLN